MRAGLGRSLRAAFTVLLLSGSFVTASVAIGVIPASATGLTLYAAAPSALGTGDCSTPADACTLTTALSDVAAGGTIELVTPGSSALYSGRFTDNTPGTSASHPVTIQPAPGVTNPTLDGDGAQDPGATTVLTVFPSVYFAISGVIIQNGNSYNGGGIDNAGTLTVADSTLSNNISPPGGAGGGGIDNNSTLTVIDSTISGNSAPGSFGGGIENGNPLGSVTVVDSTISGNSADGGGALANEGTMTVTASTLSGNSATFGAGIEVDGGSVTLGASIVAGNTGSANCEVSSGTITSAGFNLANDHTCNLVAPTDLFGNPDLGPLANNGGPTETLLPLASSPAIGAIPAGTDLNGLQVCPGTDQRDYSRPGSAETDCTIGAVEANALPSAATPEVPSVLLLPASAAFVAGGAVVFTRRRRRTHRQARPA